MIPEPLRSGGNVRSDSAVIRRPTLGCRGRRPAALRLPACAPEPYRWASGRICAMKSSVAIAFIATVSVLVAVAPCIAFAESGEMVMQTLEPTGGKIARPKEWYYSESHGTGHFRWILSREDTRSGGAYTTGVTIQTYLGVQARTGRSAKQFVTDYFSTKAKQANVLNICKEQDQGLFVRVCLETEEGQYRVLYSGFWGSNGMDVAVVSTAGTKKSLWKKYESTFNAMSSFELIDMNRFPE